MSNDERRTRQKFSDVCKCGCSICSMYKDLAKIDNPKIRVGSEFSNELNF